jgi:hypothetical protein
MPDISAILGSTKVALEKQATDHFGSAVEDFVRGSLGLPGTIVPGTKIGKRDPYTWYSSSYASALSGGTNFRPKLKFLFKVEFAFTPEAVDAYREVLGGKSANDFTFMIKAVDRPKVDFEYEDDVNRYNFRTKVLKKIRHRELTLTFMDDTGNRVFDFFRTLMFLHSPITKRALSRDGTLDGPNTLLTPDDSGMAFSSVSGLGTVERDDIAHRGVINSAVGGSIAYIRVKQMFVNPSGNDGGGSKSIDPQMVVYDFINPRITSFDLDDLTHESSDPSLLTMQFDYDWMEMVKTGTLYSTPGPIYNITVPGVTNAPVDILNGKNAPKETAASVKGISPGGGGNPYLNILTNQAARAAQKITSDAVNKAVKSVAGSGPFATAIAGSLSSVGRGINGLVSAGASDLLTGAASSAKSTYTSITRPTASDSSTLGSDNAKIVRSTDGGG